MAVVERRTHPVLPITDRLVLPDSFVPASRRDAARELVVRIARSVGRVVMLGDPRFEFVGTAFVVGPRHAITARHLADLFTGRSGESDRRHFVRFGERPDDETGFAVLSALRHPRLDVAVLELDVGDDVLPPPLTLDGREPVEPGRPVAVIGMHGLDTTGRTPLEVLMQFEGPVIGSKVVAPGHVLHEEAAKLPQPTFSGKRSVAHDCTTLAGSAGAPLIGLEDGAVLGIHFAGVLFERNYAVPASELARDPRMRDLITFSPGSVAADLVAGAGAWGDPIPVEPPRPEPAPDAIASLTDRVDAALARLFGHDLEAALAFIEKHGPAWQQAVEAQPGRGRIANDKFRRAVVDRLVRRDLVDDRLRAELDLEPISDGNLTPGTLEALKSLVLQATTVEDLVLGSPMIDVLAPTGVVEAWPDLVARLNLAGERGRDALAQILEQMGVIHPPSAQEVVDKAREELAAAGSAARLTIPAEIDGDPRGEDMVGIAFLQQGAAAARSVCRVRVAQNGPAARRAGSSGWLLAPDLVVAPAHIAPPPASGSALPLRSAIDPQSFTVEFADGGPDDAVRTVGVREVASLDLRTDIMILRLEHSLSDRAPLQVRTGPAAKGPITAIHHPHLGPKVLSYVDARLLSDDGHLVRYLCATFPGSGGAPILDRDWRVVATHLASTIVQREDGRTVAVKTGNSVRALVENARVSSADPALWQTIVAAQTMLRSVDVAFSELIGDSAVPAVITVLETLPDSALLSIDGLTLLTRDDSVVTATVTRSAVDQLAETPGILSVKASQPSAQAEAARSLPFVGVPLDRAGVGEEGECCLVALIDDGIDPFHKTFFTADAAAADGVGRSRIELYWDQTAGSPLTQPAAASPAAASLVQKYGLLGGTLYVGSDFDVMRADPPAALRAGVEHGTAVASIVAGRPLRPPDSAFCGGVAPLSPLLVVRYDDDRRGHEQSHLQAFSLIERYAGDRGLPVVVNISNGTNLGAHDGSSEVEERCTTFCKTPNRVIVKSAGNEGRTFRHKRVDVTTANPETIAWWAPPATTSDADQLELWFSNTQSFTFVVVDPHNTPSTPIIGDLAPVNEILSGTDHLIARYETMSSANSRSKVELRITPAEGNADGVSEGKWHVHIYPRDFNGRRATIHAWLKQRRGETADGQKVQFEDGDASYSITIPGNAEEVITVAAMEASANAHTYSDNSRGPTIRELVKPDLLAPGMHIQAALAGSDDAAETAARNGTSFAAPHVTGAVALALSLFHKSRLAHPGLSTQLSPKSHIIMAMLKTSAVDFIDSGDVVRGFGRLDIAAFLKAVRARINVLTTGPSR